MRHIDTPPPPTFEEFVAEARSAFAFLSEFGFSETALPNEPFINKFQLRFSNGKLTIAVEGISWGTAATTNLIDAAGVRVPLILFVPPEKRSQRFKRPKLIPGQLEEIREDAQWLRNHCVDLMRGDMERFNNRAAEWHRITNRRP